MQTQSTKSDYSGQTVFVGIDTHLKSWNVTVMMEPYFSKTFSQDPKAAALHKYLSANFPGAIYRSAYEAGFAGFAPHFQLKELGIDSIVVNPADIPTTGKEKVQKTDARDSKKIAKALKHEILTPIYVPSKETLADRSLVRFRKQVVQDLVRTKNRIKFFLYANGIDIPEEFQGKHWSRKFMVWLAGLEIGAARETLAGHIINFNFLYSRSLELTRKLKELSLTFRYKENAELLQSVPGIGIITTMTFLTEIEDINRFSNINVLASFVGMVPSTHSSGENERPGELTPRGHKTLKDVLIEASWKAIGKDPVLALSYKKHCLRMKSQKAITRVAKKLLIRIMHVLKNKTKYELGKL